MSNCYKAAMHIAVAGLGVDEIINPEEKRKFQESINQSLKVLLIQMDQAERNEFKCWLQNYKERQA